MIDTQTRYWEACVSVTQKICLKKNERRRYEHENYSFERKP